MNTFIATLALMQILSVTSAAAEPVGKEALLKLNSFAQIEGQFTQVKTLQELDVTIKTEGVFSITKSVANKSLFHWSIKKPNPSFICIDSEGLQISSGAETTKKKKIKFSEMGSETNDQILNFFKLLSLNQENAADLFTIEKAGKGFLLTPKAKEKSLFKSVKIEINNQGLVENLQVEEKSQDQIAIHFFNLKTKKIISAEQAQHLQCEK